MLNAMPAARRPRTEPFRSLRPLFGHSVLHLLKTPDLCRILCLLLDILDIGCEAAVCRGALNLISDAAQMSEHKALCGAESC